MGIYDADLYMIDEVSFMSVKKVIYSISDY